MKLHEKFNRKHPDLKKKVIEPKLPDKIYIDRGIIDHLVRNGEVSINIEGDNVISLIRSDNYTKGCWLCGSKDVTRHHVIPKVRNPRHNITIPLCRSCHDKMHTHNMLNGTREVVYFKKDADGKMRGNIQNGKIVFPDKSYNGTVISDKFYDCKIFQLDHVAFARDIKEFKIMENKEIVYIKKPKETRIDWVRM